MPSINNNLENQNLDKDTKFQETKFEMSKFIEEISKKIKKVEDSIWVVDRFEENFAICENRETKELRKIELEKLPKNLKEGNILKLKNNQFDLDKEEEEKIAKRIQEKMNNIWE